jgi:hypothetical protein
MNSDGFLLALLKNDLRGRESEVASRDSVGERFLGASGLRGRAIRDVRRVTGRGVGYRSYRAVPRIRAEAAPMQKVLVMVASGMGVPIPP